jgi:myo-inositol-1-phosphate synthase
MSTVNGRANGARRNGGRDDKVRVAVVGVGNCASSFVQGVEYYKDADPTEQVPGLMHVDLGGYHVRDIEFTAAFDIDADKVGKDLSEAIWAGQNNTMKFSDVPKLGVKVHRGMTHDGLGKYLKQKITKAPGETADIVGILQDTQTDVLVCYLPVGSEQATKWYVEQALAAGVGFVNCLPVFIAREDYWDRRFEEAGLPIIGDDIKSRSAPRSCTASWRGCSRTGACAWSAPASSTSAGTWTSTTCSSASGWSPRRSRRRTRSPRSWTTSCPRMTSTSAPRTTCRG